MAQEPPSWSDLLGIGVASAVLVGAGFGLGWWIDGLTDSSPTFVLVGILVGIVAAGAYTWAEIRKFMSTTEHDE